MKRKETQIRTDRFGAHVDGDQVTYFGGEYDAQRMKSVRGAIEHVRKEWGTFKTIPKFVREFIASIEKERSDLLPGRLIKTIESSFETNRNWADRTQNSNRESSEHDYPLVRLYTNDLGYQTLFKKINEEFRSGPAIDKHHRFIPSTWLIELMNLELFKIAHNNQNTGRNTMVYRGTIIPARFKDAYIKFESQEDSSTFDRNISIPLGLHSASQKKEVACSFLKQLKSVDTDEFGVIWNIHIIQLSDVRLSSYRQVYNRSVVSQICATEISRFSDYLEHEVLLRGPFFEVLDFRQSKKVGYSEIFELHAVMVDANRDHISTFELGDKSDDARTLFTFLVSAEKYEACAKLALDLGKPTLAKQYKNKAEQAEQQAARHLIG